ncbi:MAG TPA: tyrosine-type recombinase/integrase [Thermaerobacter sp.]
MRRHLVRAGLWRASAHKPRHTFGTRLAEAGVDLLVIKDLLGHATVATTQIYAHVAQRRLREAVNRLA